jgi:arsenate reductase
MKNILVFVPEIHAEAKWLTDFLTAYAKDSAEIYSAGIETHGLNPGAVAIMKEAGIDISNHSSNHVDEYGQLIGILSLTVCDHANENCPFIPAPHAKRLHHNFSDPSKVRGTDQRNTPSIFKNTRRNS